MRSYIKTTITALLGVAISFAGFQTLAKADEINIYSYRAQMLLQPFLDAYSAETGTSFNVVHAPKGLLQRLRSEGANSPADMVLTVDVSRIAALADEGVFEPLSDTIIRQNVPAYLRDDTAGWTALSLRARVVAISNERVAEGEITRIEDLADPKWEGRICTRKGSHVYNRALLASLIAHHGSEAATKWAEALVDNLARKPQGNDRAQAKAIWAGECDVAIMNSYYVGKMKFNNKETEQQDWAEAIQVVYLNQADRGQHVNISAGGVLKNAKNKEAATAFLGWLTTDKAQKIYADINFEYPVVASVQPHEEVASWGKFKMDELPISEIAKNSPEAQLIIDRVRW
ncbi:MAG: extracellular solute-binding protein [Candidatus Puniceispirillaceae bacterium]